MPRAAKVTEHKATIASNKCKETVHSEAEAMHDIGSYNIGLPFPKNNFIRIWWRIGKEGIKVRVVKTR